MGRRKIEIKPIRDDRNRSVTFLKRKGGLFKKAHELSVLCQVDVAVIIFGHNKKLYEYSSGDMGEIIGRFQYYGGPHEHKGPQDYADKGGGDDDEDDEEGGGEEEPQQPQRNTPQPDQQQMMGIQTHPAFQHVRHVTPQGSPPMHNGAMPQFQRGPSPLPPGVSRPSSRAEQQAGHIRRTSSHLVPPQHQQGQMQQPGYAYQPNPPFYNPQMQRPPGPLGPPNVPQGSTYPPPYQQPGASNPQMQQVVMQDARRSSMPSFPQPPPQANMQRDAPSDLMQAPHHPQPHTSPRPPQQSVQRATPSPRPPQQHFTSPPIPQPRPLPAHAKSQSMFTPIDDSRSMLAQNWGSTSVSEAPRSDALTKQDASGPRSASVDVAAMQREREAAAARSNGVSPPQPSPSRVPAKSPQPTARHASTPSAGARSSIGQSDVKRPRLKVQIPSEQSDGEGGSDKDEDATARPKSGGDGKQGPAHGVVLPPPSPSTNALLSAGAQGPPNPFARPAPPMSTNPHAMNRDANHVETPISALPSRFMSESLLPSPSAFYQDWGFRSGGDSAGPNMLPSPLNFQTPVVSNGAGWREEDRRERERELDRKRANEDESGAGGSEAKKSRT